MNVHVGDGTASIVMEGTGLAFHFVGTHGGTADPPSAKPSIWDNQRTSMVGGLGIVGANSEADGIDATGTMQLTITRAIVGEARHAIHLTTKNRNVIISDCLHHNNRCIGVFFEEVDLHQSNIIFKNSRDCTLNAMHIDGVLRQPEAVVIEDCARFNITNCTILDSDRHGILLKNVSNSMISGCLISDQRADRQAAPSMRVEGGKANVIGTNSLLHGSEIDAGAASKP